MSRAVLERDINESGLVDFQVSIPTVAMWDARHYYDINESGFQLVDVFVSRFKPASHEIIVVCFH